MAFLYQLTAPNGKAYLGITNHSPEQRWGGHLYSALKNSKLAIHCAIRKYGWDNFKKEVLVEGTFAYVKDLEVKAIAVFNTFAPNGYNLTKGGDGITGVTFKHTDEAKAKISAASLSMSAESHEKASVALKALYADPVWKAKKLSTSLRGSAHPQFGRASTFRGKKHTPETIAKMQLAQKGHLGTMNGKHHTEEAKEKIAVAQRGEKAYWFGKTLAEETKQKMSAVRKGKVTSIAIKELLSTIRKAQWADPIYRAKNIAGQQNKVYTCPHCSKSGGGGMLRWHFDHCKLNVENA